LPSIGHSFFTVARNASSSLSISSTAKYQIVAVVGQSNNCKFSWLLEILYSFKMTGLDCKGTNQQF
jgi:hypothetical protein